SADLPRAGREPFRTDHRIPSAYPHLRRRCRSSLPDPDQTSHVFRDANQPGQFCLTESPPALDAPSVAEHQCKAARSFGRRFQLTLDQALFRTAPPPQVTPQRTQDHSRLPAVLDLREATGSILLQKLLNFFFASPSCHHASLARFRHAAQEGFVG